MAILRCPCDSGLSYAECCGPLHRGTAAASTAEQLMRSRYSAFAIGRETYLLATWHSTTRPHTVTIDPELRWTGLQVLNTVGGRLLDAHGIVEFRAEYARDGLRGVLHERSRFLREEGVWRYLDGTTDS